VPQLEQVVEKQHDHRPLLL
jgi:hypothetical protein